MLRANDVPESLGEQTRIRTEVKLQSLRKVERKQTSYLLGFQQEEKSKPLLVIVPGGSYLLGCRAEIYLSEPDVTPIEDWQTEVLFLLK
jgi:hypothetical protein